MKKIFFLMVSALMSVTMMAGVNDLLWDYMEKAPSSSPDNGLYYSSNVNDAEGTNNGLKGIKLNSSGYAYFTKAAVEGTLKLTFGPRQNSNKTSLKVETWEGDAASATKPETLSLIENTAELTESGVVQVKLTAEQNNIFIERNLSVETVLQKVQFIESVPRTFEDFEMIMCNMSEEYDPSDVPAGVTFSGEFNNDQHGYRNFTITVPVDGPIRFTLGDCKYGNQSIVVKNQGGETIETLTYRQAGCYAPGGDAEGNVFPYIYTGDADVLTFGPIQYMNYFKAEATDITPCQVIFKDQNDKEIGRFDTYEGASLTIPYDENDLTIEDGSKFRGWFYASGEKAKGGDNIMGNTTIQARVTPIETATVGSVQTYNFASKKFYPEDHETVTTTGGSYFNEHGWLFNADGTISFEVAGNAYVVVTMCTYSETGDIVLSNGETEIDKASLEKNVTPEGTEASFRYAGEATTLTLSFTAKSYIHKVVIYNVLDFLERDEATGYYMVPAGDAAAFLLALVQANATGNAKIFLPNGTYDLGETVLTTISANNIAIIGESMEGTIIKNAPDASTESINNTATLYVTGNNTYFQDLTIQNALDYYKNNNGRAVALWDKGTKTICKNVRLLSYQDTYYSNKIGAVRYFEGGSIHGTVDYICGDGSVYFWNVELYCEKRNANGGGADAVTASNADKSDKGYVFEGCTLRSECPTVSLGRAWNNKPQTVFLNTIVDYSAGEFSFVGNGINRWTNALMNADAWPVFGEYNTTDTDGKPISPETNQVTFTSGEDSQTIETIIPTIEKAAKYSYATFFGTDWDPATEAQQAVITVSLEDNKVTWAGDGEIFLVYINNELYIMTDAYELDLTTVETDVTSVAVRAANARGGFCQPTLVDETTPVEPSLPQYPEWVDEPTFLPTIQDNPLKAYKRLVNGMLEIEIDGEKYNVLGQKIVK